MMLRRPRNRVRPRHQRSAFTTLELLVVVTISAIILSLIFVTVGKVYELLKSWK